jgi:hypothetical protein
MRPHWLALIAGIALASEPSSAEPNAEAAPRTAPLVQCRSANALEAIACELTVQLPRELGKVAVAAAPVRAEVGERLDELSARLVHVVAGRFDAASELPVGSLAAARARRTDAAGLVYLTPSIRGASFEVTLDLYPVARGFWERVKAAPGPLAHAFAARRIDGEIGSFLPTPTILGQVEAKATLPTDTVTAVACADVDGDRALDLVVNGRRDLYLGHIRQGRFQPGKSASWNELSPVAGAPLRQPIAALHVKPGQYLEVGTTDRRDLVRLAPDFSVLSRVPSKQPWGDLGCTKPALQGLEPVVFDCVSERAFERLEPSLPLDTVAGGTFETRTGTSRVLAARAVGSSLLELQDGDGRSGRIASAGAQATVADLDRDGLVEVLSSKDTLRREDDSLRVHRWTPDGLELVYELAVPTGIDALTACPAEDTRASLVVLATGRELWFVR